MKLVRPEKAVQLFPKNPFGAKRNGFGRSLLSLEIDFYY